MVRLPNGGSVAYRDFAGPPGAETVLLLHGIGMTADLNWGGSLAMLRQRFRVLAPDLRGHGRSGSPSHSFRLEDCADDVVALADALGIERFIAVGYSMGGLVAQLLWRRHPRTDQPTGVVRELPQLPRDTGRANGVTVRAGGHGRCPDEPALVHARRGNDGSEPGQRPRWRAATVRADGDESHQRDHRDGGARLRRPSSRRTTGSGRSTCRCRCW